MDSRRVTNTMGLIVLICFFLPWVQLSCGTSENRLSGVDLARDGNSELWLIPLLMLALLFLGMARGWKERRELSALVVLVAGLVSAYLMNRETSHSEDYFLRVAAAFLAAREREAAERLAAALRAWRESAFLDAALRPSRLSAARVARERLADFLPLLVLFPLRISRAACSRVSFDALFGGGSFTPARRAFDSPIAIACLVERAP